MRNDTEWLQYFLEQEVSDNRDWGLDSGLVGTDYSNVNSSGGTFTAKCSSRSAGDRSNGVLRTAHRQHQRL